MLSLADRIESESVSGAAETTSPEYQTHLATFLASLVFWQDLLEHCTSIDIKHTLLDHFQFLFLQQLLYVLFFVCISSITNDVLEIPVLIRVLGQ